MLFNSYTYLLLFLPLVAIGFHLLRGSKLRLSLGWLVVTSLVFYGVWNPDPNEPWSPKYVVMILASCTFNYFLGRKLSVLKHSHRGKVMLGLGIGLNLAALAYFKYAGFLAGIATDLTGWPGAIPTIILPLAISFFTFLQIAYLVDAWKGLTEEYHFTDYLLFVTFFPHLIAGPLIHHREMMPQFRKKNHGWHRDFPVGLGIFMTGMFLGGSVGSAGATFFWSQGGWGAVSIFGAGLAVVAAVLQGFSHRRTINSDPGGRSSA